MEGIWGQEPQMLLAGTIAVFVLLISSVEFLRKVGREKTALLAAGNKMKAKIERDLAVMAPRVCQRTLIRIKTRWIPFTPPKVLLIFRLERSDDQEMIEPTANRCVNECLLEPQWHCIETDKMFVPKTRGAKNERGHQQSQV